ncbi:vitamin B12 ABC transporter ATP-binding protein BtuD [Vibrio sp. SCSIO 43135]|uniref:vitamin B12 ABC transporter ATP-binding protein BtuD n=1 Tax=Vibrio sp. SCSIO 43135 TaxID=2819096 RepID=UPI0020750189|nr:vitamin B12 ABC transporter ATP-binding protein BtuD [Vibrio sp. SCSIO 43135]USD39959.1 vitamin B12 ABC transporter ATP-binding protein BtuD [Vibrio sp. SCSIO 43135]
MIRVNSLNVGSRLLPLSFQCEAGQVMHIIGPNGSGKSTLLNALSGVQDFLGDVSLDELDVAKTPLATLALHRSYLSQSDRPAFNIEVFQYLALSIPSCCSIEDAEVQGVIRQLTELLEIEDKLHRSIHHLSGGEWQRVRLAAICLQVWPTINPYAKVLLLDEPGAPLDIGQETLLYKLIDEVARLGLCVIMANHDLNRTLRHADTAMLLNDGVLQKVGPVNEVLTPTLLSEVYRTEVQKVDINGKPYLIFE